MYVKRNIVKPFYLIILLLYSCIHINAQISQDTCRQHTAKNLADSIWKLEEVEVTAGRTRKAITGTMSGRLVLQADALKNLPQFLGTADIIRTMRLMPGVQTTGEGNSGLYIRGAEPSHNLLLLNDAPIYNPMHLMGFFSIFNGSHLNRATLLKSYISPQYGGRLGSTLSIGTRDSLTRRIGAEGNIGLISSQGTLSIPVSRKSSLYLSARGTYLNPILGLFNSAEDGSKLRYGFQDYNLTYIYAPSEKSKIIINGYFGNDKLTIKQNDYQVDAGIQWSNLASSIQWQLNLRKNRRLEQTLFFSEYENKINIDQSGAVIRLPSDIKDMGYKGNYSFYCLKSHWTIGADYTYHQTHPQYPEVDNLYGTSLTSTVEKYKTHETGAYLNCDAALFANMTAHIGLRYSSLFHVSPNGQLSKYYGGLEPRFSLEYELHTNQKVILSYALQRQYMNQVAVSTLSFPIDFWVPASQNILPQLAHSFSAGYFQSIFNDSYEISVEGYYKRLTNQLEFKGGLFDMINQQYIIEDRLLSGDGYTYGGEWMIKKNKGRLTGWISYTLGWSRRKFPAINNGKFFPAKHDRRHDLSIVTNYRINTKWDCSAVFVYATGSALTVPISVYMIGENAISEYGPHNGARMPAYHRLDLSVNYWFNRGATRESGLNFSLYNAYVRKNPISLGYSIHTDKENKTAELEKRGPGLYRLIPSISYMFKF